VSGPSANFDCVLPPDVRAELLRRKRKRASQINSQGIALNGPYHRMPMINSPLT
jgi:hypothetical protein